MVYEKERLEARRVPDGEIARLTLEDRVAAAVRRRLTPRQRSLSDRVLASTGYRFVAKHGRDGERGLLRHDRGFMIDVDVTSSSITAVSPRAAALYDALSGGGFAPTLEGAREDEDGLAEH